MRAALAEHDGVLSLGGGAVTSPGVCEALAGHTVIYLEINAAEGVRRTGGNTVRPLLAGPDRAAKFRALMAERVPLYRGVATMRVDTNRRNPGAVVRYIVSRLQAHRPEPGRQMTEHDAPVTVQVAVDPPYPVMIGRDLSDRIGRTADRPAPGRDPASAGADRDRGGDPKPLGRQGS